MIKLKSLVVISLCILFNLHTVGSYANEAPRIPIEIHNDLVLIKGSIGEIEGYFVWDNGFSFSAINQQLPIKKEAVEDAPIVAKDPLGKDIHLELYKIASLKLGEVEIEHPQVLTINIEEILPCGEYTILGFIGGNIINLFSWSFNFDQNLLQLNNVDFPVDNTKAVRIKYIADEHNQMHYMPLSINGVDGFTLIDWGYTGTSLSVLDRLSYIFAKSQQRYTVIGNTMQTIAGNSKIDKQMVLDNHYRLNLGAYEVPDASRPPVNFVSTGATDVTLGNFFFRQNYNVIINSTQLEYVLLNRTNQSLNEKPESTNYGITLSKLANGNLQIDGMIKEHPYVQANPIDPSMEIIAINGIQSTDFSNACALNEYTRQMKKEDKSLVIKFSNGQEHTFRLIDIWSVAPSF